MRETCTEGRLGEETWTVFHVEAEDWRETATSQGMPKIVSNYQTLGERHEIDSPTLVLLFYFPLLLLFRSHDLFYLFIFTSLRYKLPKSRVLFYFVVNKYLLNPEIHLLLQARRLNRVYDD